jgi:hypothetical protein
VQEEVERRGKVEAAGHSGVPTRPAGEEKPCGGDSGEPDMVEDKGIDGESLPVLIRRFVKVNGIAVSMFAWLARCWSDANVFVRVLSVGSDILAGAAEL